MRLQVNYDQMSNEQLVTELEHRSNTFGDNLSTYTTGAERCYYQNKEYYFGVFDDQHQFFTLIEPQNYDTSTEVDIVITPDNPEYRNLIIQLLKSPFITIYGSYEYSLEHNSFKFEDQHEYLKDLKCIECYEEHAIPCHLEKDLMGQVWEKIKQFEDASEPQSILFEIYFALERNNQDVEKSRVDLEAIKSRYLERINGHEPLIVHLMIARLNTVIEELNKLGE